MRNSAEIVQPHLLDLIETVTEVPDDPYEAGAAYRMYEINRHHSQLFLFGVLEGNFERQVESGEDIQQEPFYNDATKGEQYAAAVVSSVSLYHMRRIADQHDFIVGGENGELTAGNFVSYDPDEMPFIDNEMRSRRPRRGDRVLVHTSQVHKEMNGRLEEINAPHILVPNPQIPGSEHEAVVVYLTEHDKKRASEAEPWGRFLNAAAESIGK